MKLKYISIALLSITILTIKCATPTPALLYKTFSDIPDPVQKWHTDYMNRIIAASQTPEQKEFDKNRKSYIPAQDLESYLANVKTLKSSFNLSHNDRHQALPEYQELLKNATWIRNVNPKSVILRIVAPDDEKEKYTNGSCRGDIIYVREDPGRSLHETEYTLLHELNHREHYDTAHIYFKTPYSNPVAMEKDAEIKAALLIGSPEKNRKIIEDKYGYKVGEYLYVLNDNSHDNQGYLTDKGRAQAADALELLQKPKSIGPNKLEAHLTNAKNIEGVINHKLHTLSKEQLEQEDATIGALIEDNLEQEKQNTLKQQKVNVESLQKLYTEKRHAESESLDAHLAREQAIKALVQEKNEIENSLKSFIRQKPEAANLPEVHEYKMHTLMDDYRKLQVEEAKLTKDMHAIPEDQHPSIAYKNLKEKHGRLRVSLAHADSQRKEGLYQDAVLKLGDHELPKAPTIENPLTEQQRRDYFYDLKAHHLQAQEDLSSTLIAVRKNKPINDSLLNGDYIKREKHKAELENDHQEVERIEAMGKSYTMRPDSSYHSDTTKKRNSLKQDHNRILTLYNSIMNPFGWKTTKQWGLSVLPYILGGGQTHNMQPVTQSALARR